ncbi:MAG: ABC transporter ATP-binding protein [Akkermansia sp.]
MSLLSVRHLSVTFRTHQGPVYAVNDVSFELAAGETLGMVGESGSGKSVTCSALMGLLPTPPAEYAPESRALFDGLELLHAGEKRLAALRGRRISMIFQDPMTSLNPCMCIGDQVAEPLIIHRGMSRREARRAAVEELARTGIPEPEKRAAAYPHEFSGGMRQRVMIAMALITRPEILIADEPTTALDVTVQKQVLDLLRERQRELGTAIILITHDLGVVKAYADRIQVMYAGSIVESAPAAELLAHPRHAYTRSLMASIPGTHPVGQRLPTIPGLSPTLREPVRGCAFRPRNLVGAPELCLTDRIPELVEIAPQHLVRNCPGCLAVRGD